MSMFCLLIFSLSFVGCLPLEVIKSSMQLKMQCLLIVLIVGASTNIITDGGMVFSVVLGVALALPIRAIVGCFQYVGELIDWSRGQSLLEWSDPVSQQQMSSIGGAAGFVAWMWCFEHLISGCAFIKDSALLKAGYSAQDVSIAVFQFSRDIFYQSSHQVLGLLVLGSFSVVALSLVCKLSPIFCGATEIAMLRWVVTCTWIAVVILGAV
jgi:flagellar biosynthesis protein FliR